MNKNDLIKTDNTIFRVLAVKDKVLVIDCIKRTMPYWVDKLTGKTISEQDLQTETGVILPDIEELSPNLRRIAYERYTIISSAVAVIDDKPNRNSMIGYATEAYKLSKQACIFLTKTYLLLLHNHPRNES